MSLIEMLAMTTLVGLLALMLAPTESFLLRTLRASHSIRSASDLSAAAARLAADARSAERWTGDGTNALHLLPSRESEVVWSTSAQGLTRTALVSGEVASVRTFPGVRALRVLPERAELLSAVLVAETGEERAVVAGLRNAGRGR
jgi:hypothetical protein